MKHLPLCLLALVVAGSHTPPAVAADSEPIHRAIRDFLDRQAPSLPGPSRHEIGSIAASGIADGCRSISVSMPPGAKPWGRTHVQARCTEGANWNLYVPVAIHVTADYVVSARPLRPGQAISESDLALRRGDLAELPANVLTDTAQALGLTASVALPAERPLRSDLLRKPVVVRQGQSTRVVSGGSGFQVAGEGRALGNAVAGQVVQVRMNSGQTVSGLAQADGTVRVGQ
ncbi:MAG: flagellar basal body P-ring formation protein FlgA [Rhodocyclales bacterium]|nr:flagellar basal body P-ring formation protein FlgA [Rhodocyclales bacterium]